MVVLIVVKSQQEALLRLPLLLLRLLLLLLALQKQGLPGSLFPCLNSPRKRVQASEWPPCGWSQVNNNNNNNNNSSSKQQQQQQHHQQQQQQQQPGSLLSLAIHNSLSWDRLELVQVRLPCASIHSVLEARTRSPVSWQHMPDSSRPDHATCTHAATAGASPQPSRQPKQPRQQQQAHVNIVMELELAALSVTTVLVECAHATGPPKPSPPRYVQPTQLPAVSGLRLNAQGLPHSIDGGRIHVGARFAKYHSSISGAYVFQPELWEGWWALFGLSLAWSLALGWTLKLILWVVAARTHRSARTMASAIAWLDARLAGYARQASPKLFSSRMARLWPALPAHASLGPPALGTQAQQASPAPVHWTCSQHGVRGLGGRMVAVQPVGCFPKHAVQCAAAGPRRRA